jgi:FKBP-type peptidyl-prolyl cis-trans isomerase
MNAKKYFFMLSAICTLAFTSCTKDNVKTQSKGSFMNITQGATLDLSKFTSAPGSSIKYAILKEGNGVKPLKFQKVTVHYTGLLLDGTNGIGKKFDSSVDRGQHFQFTLGIGQVISGWDLSLAAMTIGEKRVVILPASLGYGANGAGSAIPGNASLIFEIELFAAN